VSDDWQPGDLALCLRRTRHGTILRGAILTVEALCFGRPGYADEGALGLFFVGVRSPAPSGAFNASRFRKIRPHAPDAEDAETIRLLNGKPAKVDA
jgi:hypothetical protein